MYVRWSWVTGCPNSLGQVSSVAHRWVPNPRYDSLEAFNNDFSTTYKPKTNVYGENMFPWLGLHEPFAQGMEWIPAAYTKLANVLWTAELQRRFDAENIPITAMSVHPGNVMSGRLSFLRIREVRPFMIIPRFADETEGNIELFTSLTFGRLINWGFSLVFISPHDGGYTPAWAAASRQVSEERDKYKGKYLVPYGVLEDASQDARREDLAKELWDTTERVLKEFKWL
jgi:hypothetical protein